MHITLKPDSDTPIFQQIHDSIILAIARGDIKDGEKLYSVRAVAAEFGINPATVQKAYDLLREEGIVSTANRSGSVVRIAHGVPSLAHQERMRESLAQTVARALVQGFNEKELRATLESVLADLQRNPA